MRSCYVLTPTAHWLEYADWWNPVIEEPLRIENGMTAIAGAQGSGITFDERAIARDVAHQSHFLSAQKSTAAAVSLVQVGS